MATFIPEHYLLRFTPDPERFTFTGHTEITGTLDESTETIELDALELEIHGAEVLEDDVDSPGEPLPAAMAVDEEAQRLVLSLTRAVAGRIRIAIDYIGVHNDKLAGFYRASFTDNGRTRYMALTQFEESDARRAFPCIDRPAAKARFDVEFVLGPDVVGIANTPVAWERELSAGDSSDSVRAAEPSSSPENLRLVRFETTPPMSTYLLFFGVGPFEFHEDASDRVPVRAAARPGQAQYGKEAVEYAKESLRYGEQYTGIEFPIGKLDLIACPDFAFGAMENYGAITFRENRMLVHPEVTPAADRERVCQITCHEVAHMWFGNLVTPHDWSYIWLNEAFATYFGYVIADTFHPEFDGLDQFVANQMDVAFRRDALVETVPVEFPDGRELEYSPATVPIVYRKAASILRMFRLYLGDGGIEEGADGDALSVAAPAAGTGAPAGGDRSPAGRGAGGNCSPAGGAAGGDGSPPGGEGGGNCSPAGRATGGDRRGAGSGGPDSPAPFCAGVREFLRRHAYGCADTDEFLRAFAAGVTAARTQEGGASGTAAARTQEGGSSGGAEADVAPSAGANGVPAFDAGMLERWIRSPGYPVVTAVRSENGLHLEQKRFTLLPNDDTALWPIPLTMLIVGDDGSVDRRDLLFDTRERTVHLPEGTVAVKLNVGQGGFYRVRYDDRTLESLAGLAAERLLSPRGRFGLLYDLHAFVLAGEIELERYLSLLERRFAAEVDFLPVSQISRSLRELHSFATSNEERIVECGRSVLRPAVEAIGIRPKPGERHVTAVLRESLLWTLYLFGEPTVTAELEEISDTLLSAETAGAVPTDLRPVGYRVAAASHPGSFDTLCERLESPDVEEVEKQSIATALGCLRDEATVNRMLDYVADRLPARNRILPVAAAAANRTARSALWPWFRRSIDALATIHPFHFLRLLCDAAAYGGIGRSEEVERFLGNLVQHRPSTSRETVEMAKESLRVLEALSSRL